MKVTVAGYNIDTETLDEMRRHCSSDVMTPETLSAAYARISRSPDTAEVLRQAARKNVEKARKSNNNIVFEMGHSSIAEHAVFNMDIENVSRYLLEEIQRHRLASYTEKSQRYVKVGKDFYFPQEWEEFREKLSELHTLSSLLYHELVDSGIPTEDARYYLPLTVTTQLGMTLNARSAEHMILTLGASPLAEARELSSLLHEKIKSITPSLIRYVKPDEYHRRTWGRGLLRPSSFSGQDYREQTFIGSIRKVYSTPDMDSMILGACLSRISGESIFKSLDIIKNYTDEKKKQFFSEIIEGADLHDKMPHEFEHGVFTWELVLSAAAFAQLKRHRISTVSHVFLDPSLGFTHPVTVTGKLLEKAKNTVIESEKLFSEFLERYPESAPASYALLSGNRRRVLWTLNLREYYHFSRLREDEHAQWDIRQIAKLMTEEVRKTAPVCSGFLGGKSELAEK
ncbi:MAG: FAD-dependent thymidylate synthase [Deltaproteobacteria bacterium]|nr:FAD-dependent thymidylate synthase [Deltaproteobacteria bacterium]